MGGIRLSICIATHNRASFIGETLESALAQANEEVEIVVLDGGSTDGTPEVVRRYAESSPCLLYHRQEVKGGVDRDFDRAVGLSRGDYCWLMSDDDLLKPGAVGRVLEAVRGGHDLVVVNAEVRNADLTRVLEGRRLPFPADRIYRPGEDERLFAEVADYLSFIGGVVIRRELWLSRRREPYFGTAFIHVGVIFQEPLPGGALALADPLVLIRYGNASWTERSFEIWMFRWPELVWSFPRFSDVAKRAVFPHEPWKLATSLLTMRAKGAYSIREYREWIAPREGSIRRKIAARLIACAPGGLLNFLGTLYFRWCGRSRNLHLLDFEMSRYNYKGHLRADSRKASRPSADTPQ